MMMKCCSRLPWLWPFLPSVLANSTLLVIYGFGVQWAIQTLVILLVGPVVALQDHTNQLDGWWQVLLPLVPLGLIVVVLLYTAMGMAGENQDWFGLDAYQMQHLNKDTHPFQTFSETRFWFTCLAMFLLTFGLVYVPTIVYLYLANEEDDMNQWVEWKGVQKIQFFGHCISVFGTFLPLVWTSFVRTGFLGLLPPPYGMEDADRKKSEAEDEREILVAERPVSAGVTALS